MDTRQLAHLTAQAFEKFEAAVLTCLPADKRREVVLSPAWIEFRLALSRLAPPVCDAPSHVFKVGDRVRFAQRKGANANHMDAPPLEWEGVVTEVDQWSLILPFCVEGKAWLRECAVWWFAPEALDLLPAEGV